MRFGFVLLTVRLILPTGLVGSPLPVRRFHVVPPSVDFQMPLPAPPLVRPHVWISICQNVAYNTRGLVGSITSSFAPLESFTNSTFSQFLPPSIVLFIPFSACRPYRCPSAATYTRS